MKAGLVFVTTPITFPGWKFFTNFSPIVQYNLSFESKVFCKLIMKVNKYIHTYIHNTTVIIKRMEETSGT